ncbi:MAG TPA: DNA primase [Thermoanaerobaculia bacterium]|jgi:DNA primase|nr:DNA primase [Thermoanaerobaculia bacterium]
MALIDLDDVIISRVREAADIVDFVSQVTPLKIAGKSFKGLCPFHREKSPSFHVDRAKGLFYCFGCGTGGDVFKFLALTERFTFPEAVEHVASRVGIELPRRQKTRRENDKDDLLEALDDASEAFHQALGWHDDNPAKHYLRERGVPQAIIDKYGFGYAPDSWDYILRRLTQKHGEKKLEAAGLVTPRKEKSGYYDRFRNRLIIPIHSETGNLVGFGGRSLDGSEPKYLNSPESDVFNKSRLLYNLHRSKDAMRRVDRAILVEGYFDAIAIDHAGVPGVVASMGTSLTAGQASLIRRFTRKIVICYDGDNAGRNAALRAAQVLLAAGLDVQVLDLQGEKDPDTLVQKHGVDRFLELLSNATDVFTFALSEWATDAGALSGREKSERVEAFVPLLSAVPDPVMRNDAAQRIADAFRLEFSTVWSRVKGKAQTAMPERQRMAPNATAEKFVLIAAMQGRLGREVVERLQEELFEDAGCKTIFSIIKSDLLSGQPIDFEQIKTHLRGEDELRLLSELALSDDIDDRSLDRIDENLRPMERSYVDRRKLQIQRDIVEAEKAGDLRRVDLLVTEKMELSRILSTLK